MKIRSVTVITVGYEFFSPPTYSPTTDNVIHSMPTISIIIAQLQLVFTYCNYLVVLSERGRTWYLVERIYFYVVIYDKNGGG